MFQICPFLQTGSPKKVLSAPCLVPLSTALHTEARQILTTTSVELFFFVKSFDISRSHLESDLNFLTWLTETFVLMPLLPFLELQCGYCLSDCAPLPNFAQAVPAQPLGGDILQSSFSKLLMSESGDLYFFAVNKCSFLMLHPFLADFSPSLRLSLDLHSFIRLPFTPNSNAVLFSVFPASVSAIRRAGIYVHCGISSTMCDKMLDTPNQHITQIF